MPSNVARQEFVELILILIGPVVIQPFLFSGIWYVIFVADLVGTMNVLGSAEVIGVSANSYVMEVKGVIILSSVTYFENVTGVSLNLIAEFRRKRLMIIGCKRPADTRRYAWRVMSRLWASGIVRESVASTVTRCHGT